MKKWLLFLCFLVLGSIAFAQSKPFFTVTKAEPNAFVEFSSKKAKKAARNINQYLQLAMLQNLLTNHVDSNAQWTTNIHINNKRILSLSIQDSGKASRHFVFNAATGAVIDLPEILNPNGVTFIKRSIIKTYKTIDANHSKAAEKCLKEDIHNFMLTQDTLIVFAEKCIPQDATSERDVLPVVHGFQSQSMVKYLSNYGQAMFGSERKLKMKKMHSFALPGLYAGKQDQEAIVLQLDAPFEKQLKGVLYYTKSKKSIPLSGSFKNNRFDAEIEQGKLNLVISAGQIQGSIKQGNRVVSNLILAKQ